MHGGQIAELIFIAAQLLWAELVVIGLICLLVGFFIGKYFYSKRSKREK